MRTTLRRTGGAGGCMHRSLRLVRCALVACALLASTVIFAGCSRQATAPATWVVPQSPQSFLGPYPIGVAAGFGEVRFTLKSVVVSDREWPYRDATAVAPAGRRWVYVEFSIEGSGTNPAPGGGYFYPQFQLIADGKSIPIDVQQRGGDVEAPPGVTPRETMSFQVPASAHSAVLLAIPSYAATQTVGFRLW